MSRFVLTLVLPALLAHDAEAQRAHPDSAALAGVSQRLMDAITSGDSTVWAKWLADDWFIVDEEGRQTGRAQFLKDLRGLPPGQRGRLEVRNARFASAPGVAVLSYDVDEWHDFHGQEVRTRFHATDTWIRRGSEWRMLASQVTALPTPIAGVPVPRRTMEEYVGTYALTPEIKLRVAVGDSGLLLVRGTRPADRLHAIDDRIFIRHGVRGFWLFERDATGAVARVVSWRDNQPVVWRRER